MQKLIIIGGGISGLSAGIIAANAGLNVEIYEKNSVPGGNCAAWKKGEYTIDNCVHLFPGTALNSKSYQVWKKLKVLDENSKFIRPDSLFSSEFNGESITFWRDLDRTKNEMLAISPEDAEEITAFIELTRFLQNIQIFNGEKNAFLKIIEETQKYERFPKMLKIVHLYLNSSIEEITSRFNHPLLQKCFSDFMGGQFESYWLPLCYAVFTSGNGDIPFGGSAAIVEKLVSEFESYGGKIILDSPVKQIALGDKNLARGIFLENESFVQSDFIICACDLNYIYSSLLDRSFCPEKISEAFEENYRFWSSFQVAFGVKADFEELNDSLYFDCQPVQVAEEIVDRLNIKNYRKYSEKIAPRGQTVIQCFVPQYEKDFGFWEILAENDAEYQNKKKEVALEIQSRIEKRFPKYKGKLEILEIITPYSYSKASHNYYGSYMRFVTGLKNKHAFLPCKVEGLKNVFVANQWLRYPGGTLSAASSGIDVSEKILRKLKLYKKDSDLD